MERDPLKQPQVRKAWYVACASQALADTPQTMTLFDEPLVLFRDGEGRAGALLDRCPHRNIPLSGGVVVGGRIQCPYHGWQFDPTGRCRHIPALVGEPDSPARRCPAHPVVEQQGFVWIWGDRDSQPVGEPFRFRLADDPGYLTIRRSLEADGSVHAVAENALDVPHTAFLHGGLFRVDRDRNEITCRIRRDGQSAECEYIGEPRPTGIVGKILAPSGGLVTHFDRFYLPSIIEVEYRIGTENHILVNGALTPLSDHRTALHAVVSIQARVPLWLIRPLAEPLALRIFGQDQVILRQQTETMRRFGDARFVSTELDVLGPHIYRLLRAAEREQPPGEVYTREVKMMV
jgi:phenylpropionate dioxygenase-like ring-hydroxylating dioxygenase large terminal subunit